jgi:hypothetical protein
MIWQPKLLPDPYAAPVSVRRPTAQDSNERGCGLRPQSESSRWQTREREAANGPGTVEILRRLVETGPQATPALAVLHEDQSGEGKYRRST